jgi:hypothetical protein
MNEDGLGGHTHGRKKPVLVSTHFTIKQINNIDTASGTVFIRAEGLLDWVEPRLNPSQWDTEDGKARDLSVPDGLWTPFLTVAEELSGNWELHEFCLSQYTKNHVYTVLVYSGKISNPVDLHNFPFDFDDIQVTTVANRYKAHGRINVAFKTDYRLVAGKVFGDEIIKKEDHVNPSNWEVLSCQVGYVEINRGQDRLRFQIYVGRNIYHYTLSRL